MQPLALFAEQYFQFLKNVSPGARLRMAPTPSGYLHIGNALNFILNWVAARSTPDGKVLLRIDDLDADRKRSEYVQDIFDTLEWLGLDWDEAPLYQSERTELYEDRLVELRAAGVLFPCRKSRRDLEPFPEGYPAVFRRQEGLSLDMPDTAWRIRYSQIEAPQQAIEPAMCDVVLRRRDGIPAYQLASFADDVASGITHIIRGADLQASTAAQQYIARVLDEQKFLNIRFLHHPLLLSSSGEKLSKSAGAGALKTIREQGEGPAEIFRLAAAWIGVPAEDATSLCAAVSARRL